MEELEEKLGSILSNPQMMQQIMSLAQSLGGSSESPPSREPEPSQPALPNIDIGMLQKLSSFAGQGSIDRDQQALLKALGPYISRDRVAKLEKAMRAAKMARLASSFLNQGGLTLLTGR